MGGSGCCGGCGSQLGNPYPVGTATGPVLPNGQPAGACGCSGAGFSFKISWVVVIIVILFFALVRR